MLEAVGLCKVYGKKEALRGVDIKIREGEVFGLLGANGAGKTTLTKCVAGLIKPTSGVIRIDGINAISSRAKAAKMIGLVPDEYNLYEDMSARQHLEFFGKIHGLRGPALARRVNEVLKIVGMADRADVKASTFSHGMKQRTCIGQAILHKPKLLILDEPTNGLDPRATYELRQIVKRLSSSGTAILLNSHVMGEVEQVCEQITILDNGLVRMAGTPGKIRSALGGSRGAAIRLSNPSAKIFAAVKAVAPCKAVGQEVIEIQGNEVTINLATQAILSAGGSIQEVKPLGGGLEDAFLKLTGGS